MKRARAVTLICLLAASRAVAEGPSDRFLFLTLNPGAALSFVNAGFVAHSILPTALFGQESGVALGLGLNLDHSFVEARLCVGSSNAYYLVAQTQLSWNWLFAERAGWLRRGPYVGAAIRYWDLVQVYAGIHNHNVVPLLDLGWWIGAGRFFVDIRLSQVVAIASFSSIPHATPGFALVASPLPGVSGWLPIGLVQLGIRL